MVSSYKAEKKRILFVGKSNVGKSSLVKTFTGKEVYSGDECQADVGVAVEIPMELPPYGSVVIVDTIPLNELDDFKQNQLSKTIDLISNADFVVIVLDAREKLSHEEKNIFNQLKKTAIPFLVAVNKIEYGINSDLINSLRALNILHFEISCKENVGIDALKSHIRRLLPRESTVNNQSKNKA